MWYIYNNRYIACFRGLYALYKPAMRRYCQRAIGDIIWVNRFIVRIYTDKTCYIWYILLRDSYPIIRANTLQTGYQRPLQNSNRSLQVYNDCHKSTCFDVYLSNINIQHQASRISMLSGSSQLKRGSAQLEMGTACLGM